MKKLAILILVTFFFLGSTVWAFELNGSSKTKEHQGASYVPGELLVKYKPSVSAAASEYYRTQWGISILRTFITIGVQHVKLPKDMAVEQALEVYKNDPDVEYAEPNFYRYATATPNDTYFGRLWGLHNTGQNVNGTSGTSDADMDAPEAWDITTGTSNVVVAVIDSGVDYNHPDLAANIWSNNGEIPGNGIDDDGNGYVDDIRGWDFVDNDNNPIDSCDHGTHVAGIIAAVGNNSSGVTGVCWTTKIMPLRALNAVGSGANADLIAAIEYASNNGAHVINNSWGGPGFSQATKDAIDASFAVVVCAAGNDGTDNDISPIYPSSYTSSNIIAVAANNQNDNLASFSNYGAISVDVAAPGTNIYSTEPCRQTVWSDNFDGSTFWTTGGTSNWLITSSKYYSAPHCLTDSIGGYQNNTNSWARAPVLSLGSHSGVKLEFELNGISELNWDFLYFQVSTNGTNWTNQVVWINGEPFNNISGTTNNAWLDASVDLGAYDVNSTVYLRFLFTSDVIITYDGWYIDDVRVTAASSSYSGAEYQYMAGTSMATPHVAGLAALIKSQNPSLTNTDIKAAIENSVDPKVSLIGKVATGGRVNAYNALPPAAPSNLSATAASASQINMTWADNSSNESGFKIERKTGSGGAYAQIATVGADVTTYNDTGLSEGTTYYYRVRAYNSTGNSSYSNDVNATTYPAAPSSLSANTASSSQINLSWMDNSSGESGFSIERKTGSGATQSQSETVRATSEGTYTQIATVGANVTTYNDTGLSAGTTYYYRVCAYNSTGDSSYSNEVNATTTSASTGSGGGGGGCFIATAAYGSLMVEEVIALTQFRDNILMKCSLGKHFVRFYYEISPPLADYIGENEILRTATRLALIPIVYGVKYPKASVLIFLSTIMGITLILRVRKSDS